MSAQILDMLQLNIDDAIEPEIPTEGDHEIVVIKAELFQSEKEGKTSLYLKGLVRVTDETNKKPAEFFIGLPSSSDDADTVNSRKLTLKRLYECLQVIYQGAIIPAHLVGSKGFVRLKTQEDEGYGPKSTVKSWLKR